MTAQHRIVLLATGTHCPVGVLTWAAWQALREADVVLGPDDLDPRWRRALADARVEVQPVPPAAPAQLATTLLARARSADVVWLLSGSDDGLAAELTARILGADPSAVEMELVLGSWDEPGYAVRDLVAVMNRLRSPGGCPWDAAQTHASLIPYAIEEAHELAEAIEGGRRDDLVEELGDLLLQVVFHARLGEEAPDEERFDLDLVATGISAKLRHRHPHVFADVHAPTAEHVEANWEQIKKAEKGRDSVFDGIPTALPALTRAQKVLSKIAKAGLPVAPATLAAPATPAVTATPEALGAAVLSVVEAGRQAGLDVEAATRQAVRGLIEAARRAEAGSPPG